MRRRVVILGAGFGGLEAARRLAGLDVSVTIVDRRNVHVFQPLLYQVATAGLEPGDIAYPIRSVFRRQRNVERILMAEVTGIDLDSRLVHLDGGEHFAYDVLVVAVGATHSYFGHDDWARFAPGLKTIEDALEIRRRILGAFEQAERRPGDADRLLTFVVVGAGPTGVELAGAIAEVAHHALVGEYDLVDPRQARVVLVEGGDRVLPALPAASSAAARRQLESLGVEVRTGAVVTAVDSGGVTLAGGERIEAATVLWAAGVEASPVGALLGVDCDRVGRVIVEADLSLPGRPEVFVVGDLASVPGVPGVAPAAIQMGRHVARQIRRDLTGAAREPFRYRDKGTLATIGRHRGVAVRGRLRLSGYVAWVAWLAVHIWFLIGFRNRLVVMLEWAWSYLTYRRGARVIVERE